MGQMKIEAFTIQVSGVSRRPQGNLEEIIEGLAGRVGFIIDSSCGEFPERFPRGKGPANVTLRRLTKDTTSAELARICSRRGLVMADPVSLLAVNAACSPWLLSDMGAENFTMWRDTSGRLCSLRFELFDDERQYVFLEYRPQGSRGNTLHFRAGLWFACQASVAT